MTSVDELFKKPGLPSTKRKLDATPNPNEIYKSAKLSANGDAKGGQHKQPVEEDEQGEDSDGVAGPELPPDDEGEGEPEDEEGRFFGGGVSRDTAEVLDYVDEREGQDAAPEKIDSAWLRRLALGFERRISKNAELRAKFEDAPQKFMSSEADLDADIKALSVLTDHPELYAEFAKLGCVNSLVSLLAHENTDIAIDAIEILAELTDEDVDADQEQWDALVAAILDADLPDLLVQNFERLDEGSESDRNGVYHSLSLVENLASQVLVAEKIVAESQLMRWLLKRMQVKEQPTTQNKQYSAEILAILLQSSSANHAQLIALDGVDIFLQSLSAYRKRDPSKDSEEEEFAENLFDALTSLVDHEIGKQKFIDAEGIDLCLIMLREGKFSKPRALRLLDHALGGLHGAPVCEALVEAAGLKVICGLFMKNPDHSTTEHVVGMFASLLRHLPGNSAARIRTLAKFMEKDYEKMDRLVKVRRSYGERLQAADEGLATYQPEGLTGKESTRATEVLQRRLDAGLFCFQTIDVILAWLAAEDSGANAHIVSLLADTGESLDAVRATLREQLTGMDIDDDEDSLNSAEMLKALVDCLG